jgi:hypothetical protein
MLIANISESRKVVLNDDDIAKFFSNVRKIRGIKRRYDSECGIAGIWDTADSTNGRMLLIARRDFGDLGGDWDCEFEGRCFSWVYSRRRARQLRGLERVFEGWSGDNHKRKLAMELKIFRENMGN